VKVAEMIAEAPADKAALAIRNNITQVESALSEFDKISAGLAELAAKYPPDLVYDVKTTKGMAEAIAHRAAWRDPRVLVEKYRKTAKAPVLALGKDIDARAAWITEQLLMGETPVHEQIKAEEARKEAEKQAKINAEFGRVQAIQDAIAEIHMDVMIVAGKPSGVIAAKLDTMRAQALDPLVFQEMMTQAQQAQANAISKLEQALKAQLFTEAEADRLVAEREELAQLRAAQAEQKAKDEATAAELRRAEEARIAAERKQAEAELAASRAEQKRLNDEAAAARAEADRKAKAEREEADRIARETRETERQRIDAERAELKRQQDEADRKAKAEREAVEAATQRVRDAAPKLLRALVGLHDSVQAVINGGDYTFTAATLQPAREAIAEAGERP